MDDHTVSLRSGVTKWSSLVFLWAAITAVGQPLSSRTSADQDTRPKKPRLVRKANAPDQALLQHKSGVDPPTYPLDRRFHCTTGEELLLNGGFEDVDMSMWENEMTSIERCNQHPPHATAGQTPARTGDWSACVPSFTGSQDRGEICQLVNLMACAEMIDDGTLSYTTSGHFVADQGTRFPNADKARFVVKFLTFRDYNESSVTSFDSLNLDYLKKVDVSTREVGTGYDSGVKSPKNWTQIGVSSARVPRGSRSARVCFNLWETGWDAGVADDFSFKIHEAEEVGDSAT